MRLPSLLRHPIPLAPESLGSARGSADTPLFRRKYRVNGAVRAARCRALIRLTVSLLCDFESGFAQLFPSVAGRDCLVCFLCPVALCASIEHGERFGRLGSREEVFGGALGRARDSHERASFLVEFFSLQDRKFHQLRAVAEEETTIAAHLDPRFLRLDRSDLCVRELQLLQFFFDRDRLLRRSSAVFILHRFVAVSVALAFRTIFFVGIVGIVFRVRSVPLGSFAVNVPGSFGQRAGKKAEASMPRGFSHDAFLETVVPVELGQVEREKVVERVFAISSLEDASVDV